MSLEDRRTSRRFLSCLGDVSPSCNDTLYTFIIHSPLWLALEGRILLDVHPSLISVRSTRNVHENL